VKFDFYGTGTPTQMPWIAQDVPYGFLVYMPTNEPIRSARQMFSNISTQPQDSYPEGWEPNGWLGLGWWDAEIRGGDGDGKITPNDDVWYNLRVWVDTCHCGQSINGTMYTLDQLGITEIGLDYVTDKRTDQYGNQLRYKSYMIQNGHSVPLYDVIFSAK
jgi:hypothetical protein